MRSPIDRAIVGAYVCLLGWLGLIAGWLLDAPLVAYPSLGVLAWGALLNWFGVRAALRRRREHR